MKLYVIYRDFGGYAGYDTYSKPHGIVTSLEEAKEWKEQHYSHLYEEFIVDGLFQVLGDIIEFDVVRELEKE